MKKTLIVTAMIFSGMSYAEQVTPKGVGCDTVSGECYVILESAFINTTCPKKTQIRFNPDDAGTSGQYSAALAAFMAGKKLEIGSVGCYQDFVAPSYLYVTN
jgi:hypothetical protein